MAVGLEFPAALHPVGGVRLSAAHCGIKKTNMQEQQTPNNASKLHGRYLNSIGD